MISTTGPIGSADQLKDLSASDPTGAQGESGFMDMLLQALLGGQLSAEELRGWLEERGYTSEDAAAFIQSLGLPLPEGEGLGGATVDNDLASIQQETAVAWDALEEADAEALLHALQGRLDPIEDGSQRPGEADIAANLLRALMAARGAGTGESAPENRESVNLDQQLAQQRRNAWLAGDIVASWQAGSQSGFGQTVGDVLAADARRTAALTGAQAQRSALWATV